MVGSPVRITVRESGLLAKNLNKLAADKLPKDLRKQFTSVTQMPTVRKEIGQHFIRVVSPYVPYDHNRDPGDTHRHLRDSGYAESDGRLHWSAISPKDGYNYAMEQYKALWYRHRRPETAYWVNVLNPGKRMFVKSVYDRQFASFVKRKVKEMLQNGISR